MIDSILNWYYADRDKFPLVEACQINFAVCDSIF